MWSVIVMGNLKMTVRINIFSSHVIIAWTKILTHHRIWLNRNIALISLIAVATAITDRDVSLICRYLVPVASVVFRVSVVSTTVLEALSPVVYYYDKLYP